MCGSSILASDSGTETRASRKLEACSTRTFFLINWFPRLLVSSTQITGLTRQRLLSLASNDITVFSKRLTLHPFAQYNSCSQVFVLVPHVTKFSSFQKYWDPMWEETTNLTWNVVNNYKCKNWLLTPTTNPLFLSFAGCILSPLPSHFGRCRSIQGT